MGDGLLGLQKGKMREEGTNDQKDAYLGTNQQIEEEENKSPKDKTNSEILQKLSSHDIFLKGDFTYTGLLKGDFDTIYTPSNGSGQVIDNLTREGGYDGPQSSNIQNATPTGQQRSSDFGEWNRMTYDLPFDEDLWTQNLFHNLEEAELGGESTAPRSSAGNNQSHATEKQAESHSESEKTNGNTNEGREELICEEDVENFLGNEEKLSQGVDDYSIDNAMIPQFGMEFKTREEAQNFFNTYAFAVGFSVAIASAYRTTNKKRNGEITIATIKCNKSGTNTPVERDHLKAQRQTTVIDKTCCKVEMVINEKNGIWRITNLVLDHNHALSPQSKFFRSHIYMSTEEKAMIRSLRAGNITTSKIVSVLSYLRGGDNNTPYNRKKVSNYATSINRELQNSDVMEVQQFFRKKRLEDPSFYYSFQVDINNKVMSVFWADGKSRSYYERCGDCISFDTTFLTNKYNLPFAPMVGVSPHGNTYLFACALCANETADTFKWVFNEFLAAMGGKHPESIITDMDRGMKVAIESVLPHTIHRSCLFHVKKKAEEKAVRTFQSNQGLYEEFQDIIDNSLTVQEFETLWLKMIDDYQVGHIKIFQIMWKNRARFVPVYFKRNFFPFLHTTSRSEGTNALFKRGFGAQCSMTSFLREYQRIMDSIHAKENECEHNAIHKKVPIEKFKTKYYIEMQAHELYNISIFRKFQKILNDVTRLRVTEEQRGETYLLFQAQNYHIREHRPRTYVVQVDLVKEDYSCICCKFEKDGVVCSHILKVMLHLDIDKIPDHYIIDRWRKKHMRMNPLPLPDKIADNDTLRYNLLSRRMVKTASKGSTHKRKYEYLLKEMDRVDQGMEDIDKEIKEEVKQKSTETTTIGNFENTSAPDSLVGLLDPDDAKTKGRPRLMTIQEAIKAKKFYKCSHCDEYGHTLKKCHNLDKVYDLKKPKRTRKKKTQDSGQQEQDTSSVRPMPKKPAAKRRKPAARQIHPTEQTVNI